MQAPPRTKNVDPTSRFRQRSVRTPSTAVVEVDADRDAVRGERRGACRSIDEHHRDVGEVTGAAGWRKARRYGHRASLHRRAPAGWQPVALAGDVRDLERRGHVPVAAGAVEGGRA